MLFTIVNDIWFIKRSQRSQLDLDSVIQKRSQLDLDSVVHKKVTIRSRVSFIKRSQLDLDSIVHKKVTIRSR